MSNPTYKEFRQYLRLRKTQVNGTQGIEDDPIVFVTNVNWLNFAAGETLPNFKTLIRNSESATTQFSGREVRMSNTEGAVISKGWVHPSKLQIHERFCSMKGMLAPVLNTGNFHNGITDAPALSMAESQFFQRAHNAIHAIEGGELLGEIGQTVKEIKRLTRDMRYLFSDWRRTIRRAKRVRQGGRAVAGIVADSYLRWKFGWDPLVKDMKAIANDLKDDFLDVQTIKANGTSKFIHDVGAMPYDDNTFCSVDTTYRAYEETSVRFKAGIRVKRYGVGGLAETLGISPRNFLPTVYNLLPWTYMIDYFSNVGAIVEAIAFDDARIAWCNRTIRKSYVVETQTGANPRGPLSNWYDAPGYPIVIPSTSSSSVKTITRDAHYPTVPGLRLRLPNFSTEGGRIQGLNIAAVIAARSFGDRNMPVWVRD